MAELTLEQRKALALAKARRRRAEAEMQADREAMTHAADPERSPAQLAAEKRDRAVYREKPIASGVAAALQGVPFAGEYLDELAGAVLGPQTADAMRAGRRGFMAENPVLGPTAQFGTGLATSVVGGGAVADKVARLLPKTTLGKSLMLALGGGAAGGVEGAFSGYGAGETPRERQKQATTRGVLGAGMGAGIGALAPPFAKGVENAARYVKQRPDNAALREMGLDATTGGAIGEALQAEGLQRSRQRIMEAGPMAMPADAGETLSGLLDVAIQRSGGGARTARDAVEGRATQSRAMVEDAMNRSLGRVGESQSRALTVYGDKSNPLNALYRRAYAQPIDYSSDAGREIEALMNKNVPPNAIERANAMLRTDPDYEGVPQIMAQVGDDGSVAFTEMPTVAQIDLITRALNDISWAGDGKGALGGKTNEGRIYGNLARRLRSALREAVPEYAAAVNAAGTEIGQIKARDFGRQLMASRIGRAEAQEAIADMGEAELRKVREGLRESIDDALANVSRTVTDGNVEARQAVKLIKDMSSDASRAKLRMVLGQDADALSNSIDQAAAALDLRARVADNSKTFARQTIGRRVDEQMEPGVVGTALQGRPVDATQEIVQAITGRTDEALRGEKEAAWEAIAKALTKQGNIASDRFVTELARALEKRGLSAEEARALGRNTGLTGGVLTYQAGAQGQRQ
jgi:hypothetical protein